MKNRHQRHIYYRFNNFAVVISFLITKTKFNARSLFDYTRHFRKSEGPNYPHIKHAFVGENR